MAFFSCTKITDTIENKYVNSFQWWILIETFELFQTQPHTHTHSLCVSVSVCVLVMSCDITFNALVIHLCLSNHILFEKKKKIETENEIKKHPKNELQNM